MNATPQNDLRHLFDGTHCLSKRQLRDYAAGSMSREEAYAVESHLNTCPLCSVAADGMLAHFPESADVLATVDAGFLKDHFKKHSPQIHLNTVAPAAAVAPVTRRIPGSTRVIDLTTFRTVGVAAAIVLLVGSLWWFQKRENGVRQLADSTPIARAEKRAEEISSVPTSSTPESANRLAQVAPANDEREKDFTADAPKEKKAVEEMVAESDATSGGAAMVGAMHPSSVPPSIAAAPAAVPVQSEAVTDNATTTKDAINLSSTKKLDEAIVRTRRYERPLIEPKQPGSRTVLTDKEIEKMPTRNPTDAASTAPGVYQGRSSSGVSIGGGRAESTQYIVDGVMEDGKTLYQKGSYSAALKVFRRQMNAGSGAQQQEATLYAARCYRALGKNAAAEKLLRALAESTGPRARAARRELRAMGKDASTEKPADRTTDED